MLTAPADPPALPKIEIALTTASGAMPVRPVLLMSRLNSPITAVP